MSTTSSTRGTGGMDPSNPDFTNDRWGTRERARRM